MSDNLHQQQDSPQNIPPLKDAAILAGWIAGLILIAGCLWFFTQPLRDRIIPAAVNRCLSNPAIHAGLERRFLPPR